MTEKADLLTRFQQIGAHAGESVLVALDFDGTLAPLQDDPARSRIVEPGVAVLERLHAAGCHLALVSGRGLADLAQLAQVPVGTHLIGSHGAENGRMTATGLVNESVALPRAQLTTVTELLKQVAATTDGGWVETKPQAAVLHTRLVPSAQAQRALEQARQIGHDLEVSVLDGKDVVELSVSSATKGSAVDGLRALTGARTVVYAGDDRTDETALVNLHSGDVGIKVGEGDTAASYRVRDPHELVATLTTLVEVLEQHR